MSKNKGLSLSTYIKSSLFFLGLLWGSAFAYQINHLYNSFEYANAPNLQPMVTISIAVPKYKGIQYSYQDLQDMAKNVYYEARGEPEIGQAAVAYVVLNRLNSEFFPDSIHKVIYQQRPVCQFTWTCEPKYPIRDQTAWNTALTISCKVLKGEIPDPTNGSLFYHTTTQAVSFEDVNFVYIKNHVFYNKKALNENRTDKNTST